MLVLYGLVSAEVGQAIDLFLDRKAAEAVLADCLADEPEWADVLSVERVELEVGSPN